MEHFVTVVMEKQETKKLDESVFPLYETFNTEQETTAMQIPLPRTLDEQESAEYAEKLANYLFAEGYEDFDIYVNAHEEEDLDEVLPNRWRFVNDNVLFQPSDLFQNP